MAEIEFEDSSITQISSKQTTKKEKTGSYYEVCRKSLSLNNEIKSQFEYESLSELKANLPCMPLQKIKLILIRATQDAEILEVQTILDYLEILQPPPTLSDILDSKNQTLIHIASFKNQPALIEKYLFYESLRAKTPTEEIRQWIDQLNNDQYAAIHYASFVGSVQTLEWLSKFGANIFIKNQQGQNSLAIAAQGDQISAMVWLHIKGLQFNEADSKGGTPLHWATYYGSEFAVQFLLCWINKESDSLSLVNQQDLEGQTPLHLAAMTGNERIAKKLLLRGANKLIKDNRGNTPAQEAVLNQYDKIYNLLETSNCLYEFLNIRSNFKMAQTSYSQIVAFFFLYFYCMMGTIVFVYPLLFDNFWVQISSIGAFIIGLVFYFLTWFIEPGYCKINEDQKLLFDLLTNYDPWDLCPECHILKPKRSRHCEICKRCVVVYDHHCPWINNCVKYYQSKIGARNHGVFMVFIITIWINIAHIIVLNGMHIWENYQRRNPDFPWFNAWIPIEQDDSYLYYTKVVVEGSIMLICLIFLLPIAYLIYIQINNLLSNKTTFEKYRTDGNVKKQQKNKSMLQVVLLIIQITKLIQLDIVIKLLQLQGDVLRQHEQLDLLLMILFELIQFQKAVTYSLNSYDTYLAKCQALIPDLALDDIKAQAKLCMNPQLRYKIQSDQFYRNHRIDLTLKKYREERKRSKLDKIIYNDYKYSSQTLKRTFKEKEKENDSLQVRHLRINTLGLQLSSRKDTEMSPSFHKFRPQKLIILKKKTEQSKSRRIQEYYEQPMVKEIVRRCSQVLIKSNKYRLSI